MEQSTIHLKVPHWIHIGAKTAAILSGTSMNQYVVDLIKADFTKRGFEQKTIQEGIDSYRIMSAEFPVATKQLLKDLVEPTQYASLERHTGGLDEIIKTPKDIPKFDREDRQPIPKSFSARKKK